MLLRSYLKLVSMRAFGVLLALAYVALVTAWVPAAEFGRLNLVLSVAQVIGAALLAWPNLALLRYGREAYVSVGHFGSVLGARLLIHAVLLSLALPGVLLVAPKMAEWIAVDGPALMLMLGLALILLPAAELSNVVAQVSTRFVAYGMSPIIQRLAQLAVLVAVVQGLAAPSWDVLMAGNLAGYLAATIAIWLVLPKRVLGRLTLTWSDVRRMVSYSWAMPLVSLSAFLMSWMDIWFLRHFRGLEEVGIYAWAYNISLLATNLLVPLSAVLAPRSIDLCVQERPGELLKLMHLTAALVAIGAAFLPLLLLMLDAAIPHLPLGVYATAAAPLLVLAAGTIFQLGLAMMEPVVYAHGDLIRRAAFIMLAMAMTNAVLDMLLIPLFGATGPALATVAALALGMGLQWTLLGRKLGAGRWHRPWRTCLWAAVPLLAALVLIDMRGTLAWIVALGCGVILLFSGRALGMYRGLNYLGPRLSPMYRPAIGWLAHSQLLAPGDAK